MRSVFTRVKGGGVELLVEVLMTLLGETIDAASPVFYEAVLSEFAESVTTVILGCHTELIEGFRSQIHLIAEMLQNLIIDWHHPVSTFSSHYTAFRCGTHNNIVGIYLSVEGNEFNPILPSALVDSTKRYM